MSMRGKTPTPDNRQFNLFDEVSGHRFSQRKLTACHSGRRFIMGNPHDLFIGQMKLEVWLENVGQKEPLLVGKILDLQDWAVFEQNYAPTGRAPYRPRSMLGLILYGIMQGVSSLRGLERLARLDLGAMWITGGILPDHTSIGRFISQHDTLLCVDFFEALTRSICKKTLAKSSRLAGDGTVIEAACSHYRLLKEEALAEFVEVCQNQVAMDPDDQEKQVHNQQAEAGVSEDF